MHMEITMHWQGRRSQEEHGGGAWFPQYELMY